MSAPLLLRGFVKERLTAAAEEIFQFFEKTIEKYEEEASSSKQEIGRLSGLLQELSKQKELSQSVCKEESTPKQHQELSISIDQRDPEPRRIKEEPQEVLAFQQEEEQIGEHVNDRYPPRSAVWQKNEQEHTKPCLQPQTQNTESEEQFPELQETKTVHYVTPCASSPPSQTEIQAESVQDVREPERLTANFMSDQTKTEQNQSSNIISTESTELSHLNSVAAEYHCSLYDKSFPTNHRLSSRPFSTHSEDAGFVCSVCGKTFASNQWLKMHLKSHNGSNCCHVCGKHCKSATLLAEHMTVHTGVKLHRCHVCGKEVSRKGDLRIHMRNHTGEKPFRCSYCGKGFTNSGHLKKHTRSHTGERPYQCNVCGKGFLQSAHLKYHLGTHNKKY